MGLLKTAARVGVASAVHGRVQRRQQQRWAAQDQWQPAPPPAAPPPAAAPPAAAPSAAAPPPAAMADKLAQLKTLGELRDSGVLSEAEFEGAKQKVLQG
jgi:Short C-terminal domain